jgi:hypothetical protein
VYWPADLLPASLKDQHANVLVYGYNADVYGAFWDRQVKNPSDNFIHVHARTLVTTLTHYRKSVGTERHPIIWVTHSLGGIVTKRALLYSHDVLDPNQEDLRSIYVSTYGIIFLGTPHNGSNAAAWGGAIQRMADAVLPKKLLQTESVLLKSLKKDSETLQQISSHFLDIYQKFKIHMAHENQKTDVKGSKYVEAKSHPSPAVSDVTSDQQFPSTLGTETNAPRVLVVDATSASPQLVGVTYYGIEATHSGMCKFESETAPGYRTVSTAIRDWIADAPNVTPVRWEIEEGQRLVRASLDNYERTRPYVSLIPRHHTREAYRGLTFSQRGSTIIAPTPPQAIGRLLLPARQGWHHAWPPQRGRVLGPAEEEEEEEAEQ